MQVIESFKTLVFMPGEYVVEVTDRASEMYFVIEGELEVKKWNFDIEDYENTILKPVLT
jgi:mannose-6-phosphate isomerase-like protein (cupin superfamily)